jgi:hypothetical protein
MTLHPTSTRTHRASAVILLSVLAAFLAGCVTPAPIEPVAEDPLRPAPGEVVGTILYVDPEAEVAIVQLRSAGTRPAATMTTRNEAMIETSRIELSRYQRGRTLGTRILSGLPNVGDEVVSYEP